MNLTRSEYPWYLDVSAAPWDSYGTLAAITLDFETTNLDKGDSRNPKNRIVRTAARLNADPIRLGRAAWTILKEHSGKPAILVAHNAKFELGWLNREGIDTTHWLPWDTMVAEYVLSGNRQWELSLDAVSRRYGLGGKGRVIDALMKGGVCPSEQPDHLLAERVVWDVDRTHRLYELQRPKLAALGLTRVMFTRSIFTPVLAHIEPYGMGLDGPAVRAEYETAIAKRAELRAQLVAMAEGRKLKGPQLAQFVYDVLKFEELRDRKGEPVRTASGKRTTKSENLMQLKATTEEQKRFLKLYVEYNKIDSALTKNLEFFIRVVEEQGGRFVANFNQTRVQTHRLSSSGKRTTFSDGKARSVQFQNFPGAYKRLFRAGPGYVIDEADGMGLEFRCAGSMAHDPKVLEDVVSGADVHRYTASILHRIPEDKVTKEQRNKAKPNTFKPLYGGVSGTPRQQEYYEAFKRKYHVTFETQTGWTYEVLKNGQLRIPSGLIFYWPGTTMKKSGWITNTPNIFNYPVQSFATADIIPVSVVYTFWTARLEGLDARIVNTIHDSVIAEVSEKDLDKWHKVVVECFLDRTYEYLREVYGVDLYVPLGVAYRAGTNWGDGEEIKVSYPPKWRTTT